MQSEKGQGTEREKEQARIWLCLATHCLQSHFAALFLFFFPHPFFHMFCAFSDHASPVLFLVDIPVCASHERRIPSAEFPTTHRRAQPEKREGATSSGRHPGTREPTERLENKQTNKRRIHENGDEMFPIRQTKEKKERRKRGRICTGWSMDEREEDPRPSAWIERKANKKKRKENSVKRRWNVCHDARKEKKEKERKMKDMRGMKGKRRLKT